MLTDCFEPFYVKHFLPYIYSKIDLLLKEDNVFCYEKEKNYDSYIRQFGIIQINMGRRSGHTMAALDILRKYPNSSAISYIMWHWKYVIPKNKDIKNRLFSFYNWKKIENINSDILIFNFASFMNEEQIDNIANILKPKALVLLG